MVRVQRHDAIALGAIAVALPLGALASTGHAGHVLAGALGLVLLAGGWRWCRRDPAMVFAALWAFQVVRTPLAHGLPGLAGSAIDQLTDVGALVLVATLVWSLLLPDAPRRDLRFLLPAGGVAACGLLSSFLEHAPLAPTVVGLWLGTKLLLLVALAAAMRWRREDAERVIAVVLGAGALAAVLGLLDFASGGLVASTLRTNAEVTAFHFRAHAAQGVYATPNDFSMAMTLLVAIAAARVVTRTTRRDILLLALFVAAAVVSLRLKAVLCVAAVLALITVVQLLRGRRGALAMLAVGGVFVLGIAAVEGDVLHRQVTTLGDGNQAARSALYSVSGRIADDHAPFGVGFGRFGTAPSRTHYSEVYDEYGISRVWGLSREFPRFIADTSWPAVLGETGYAGLAIYVAGLLALAWLAVGRLRGANGAEAFAPLALLCVLLVVVVDSIANATLFSWNSTMTLAVVLGATLATRPAPARGRAPQRRLAVSLSDRGSLPARG